MTHINNVKHILELGITHKKSSNANPSFTAIGDLSLISTRSEKKVIVDNGDLNNLDSPRIILGDFIPFYFGIRMPMLYVIQNGGNFVEKATPPKDIVYLVCPIMGITQSNNTYYFSDGHATDALTTFYDKKNIDVLPSIIDWKSIEASYWGGHENLNTKRKKQAEFLVMNDIQPDHIIGFGCYNEKAKQKLLAYGVDDRKIKVIPRAYY